MPKFICRNSECDFFDKEVIEGNARYTYVDGKIICDKAVCPSCNKVREEINATSKFEPPSYEAVGIGSTRRNWAKVYKHGATYY